MVTVQEASRIIFSHLFKPSREDVSIQQAVGRILAEPIRADRDFPPFDRVTMDGIAILYESYQKGQHTYRIEAIQQAGAPRLKLKNAANCLEVMTGAMLPEETDCVIRYEDLEVKDNLATVKSAAIQAGQNIHKQGQDALSRDVLINPGMKLSAAEVALLASVGLDKVNVYAFPKTAIISTGNELVDIRHVPEAHQIRRSNSYALLAAMLELQWKGNMFHLEDDQRVMETGLEEILGTHDVLILSGGVSQGKFDFVPGVLEKLGIKTLFHKVSQRPGKPFWFGVSEKGKTVFALPGNPVSTFLCFYRYIKPWVLKSLGAEPKDRTAMLGSHFNFVPDLTCFVQVNTMYESGKLVAFPVPGGGSGDFANLKNVDGFLELPLHKSDFQAGESFSYIPFR